MANTPEGKLEEHFYQRVRRLGGMCEKVVPNRWGIPDRLVLLPGGRIYLVELKTASGTIRPAQSVWHRKAARLGVHVVVLRGRTNIDRWLNSIEEEMRVSQQ